MSYRYYTEEDPSPFPGMDPYLEDPAFWPDFHSTFVNYWREALVEQLPVSFSMTAKMSLRGRRWPAAERVADHIPASFVSASALSVFSQVKFASSRPKWPLRADSL